LTWSAGSRQDFVRALGRTVFTRATPEVSPQLLALFDDPWIDWQELARPVASLLLAGVDEELLHAYLRHCINTSRALEERFVALRRDALLGAEVPERLLESLAIQCFLNGFIWRVSDDETNALRTTTTALLRAMYGQPVDDLPPAARRVLIDEPAEERALGAALDGELVLDETSAAVRAQYEEHPYPRWLSLHRPEAAWNEAPGRALVAGCGTGVEAIRTALRHPTWRIEAIDVSRRSLGYAMRKARELSVDNLHFRFQDLRTVAGRYDEIRAIGVLHHLPDPLEGLRALARALAPEGSLTIGVYSRRGRASLARLRALGGGGQDLRAARERIFAALDDPAEIEDLDFFELGHFRDTLYHVHEFEFAPLELEQLFRDAGLAFEGFEQLPADVDAGGRDLRVWDAIEEQRPDLFRNLFVCRLRRA
jgi:SAM-dependent methyltransferase